jgi:hypothetical protein
MTAATCVLSSRANGQADLEGIGFGFGSSTIKAEFYARVGSSRMSVQPRNARRTRFVFRRTFA